MSNEFKIKIKLMKNDDIYRYVALNAINKKIIRVDSICGIMFGLIILLHFTVRRNKLYQFF